MTIDVWGKLWDIATSEEGEPAVISLHPEDAGIVYLTWPDGSKGTFEWNDGDWQRCEALDLAPCDVRARDSE